MDTASSDKDIMTIDNPEDGMWVLGYGSLIWKPPPHYTFRLQGYLSGFIRRFYMQSRDHRGTPANPGRVVTLVSHSDLVEHHNDYIPHIAGYEVPLDDQHLPMAHDALKVWCVAYYIPSEKVPEVKEYLDIREQDGYSTHQVEFHISPDHNKATSKDEDAVVSALPVHPTTNHKYLTSMIYLGTLDNEAYIGPENISDTALVIRTSVGDSGKNTEYLLELTKLMRQFHPDTYLEELLRLVEA